jgi:hypothetical protein
MDAMRKFVSALLVAFFVCVPAAHGKGERFTDFQITRAIGYVRVTFHGDEAAGCRGRGLCGVSGMVKRSYERPSFGRIFWVQRGTRTLFLYGFVDEGRGTIAADVGVAGSPERCVDRLRTGYDTFELEPRRGRLRFVWREIDDDDSGAFIIGGDHEDDQVPAEDLLPNPFGTRCTGPELRDLKDALPTGEIPFRVLRSRRSEFHLAGSLPFAAGGFAGTVDWNLRYGLRRERTR